MSATSVFLFHQTFCSGPFIKRENDHLEVVLKKLAAGKIFLVNKKKQGIYFLCAGVSRVTSSRQVFVAGRSTHVGNDCHGNFQIKMDVFLFELAFCNKTLFFFFSVKALN